MTTIIRGLCALVLGMGILVLAPSPAEASQLVPFSIHKGPAADDNRWHAEATGNVTFFGTGRKVRVQGSAHFHHSPTDGGFGYVQVRQNLTARPNDPAWQNVPETTCTEDPTPPGTTFNCGINKLFQPPAQPGHQLAGVWLRVCKSVKGPDPDSCGPVQYRDNPLQG